MTYVLGRQDYFELIPSRSNNLQPVRCLLALMAMSNSPTRGHPKFPQAGRPDYDDSGVIAMRAAASLSR